MKKIVSMLLASLMVVSSVVMAFAKPLVKGDANDDGEVSAVDAKKILLVVSGKDIIIESKRGLYDADGNGLVTATDARMVLRIVAGLDVPITEEPTVDETTTQEPEKEETTTEQSPVEEITEKERMMRVLEEEFLRLINEERVKNGRGNLEDNSILHQAARIRAKECIEKFSHTRPNGESYKSILQGELAYDWVHIAENIAWFYETSYSTTDWTTVLTEQDMKDYAKQFFTTFKNSSIHYQNILYRDFSETGFGVVILITDQGTLKVACSQLFGTPA